MLIKEMPKPNSSNILLITGAVIVSITFAVIILS
jgi:hypothetical protein